ncbi:hypothetical protein ACFE04_026902 [Oxalis oulophora]
MKRSVRPVFTILLIVVLALTLTCRIVLRQFVFDVNGPVYSPQPRKVLVFNSTLLNFASIDADELKAKQEIEQLLDGNFASQGRHRSFASWRKFNHHEAQPEVSNRSPKFYQYWNDFRRDLNDWARKKRFQADIMMDLVRLVKNPIDSHYGLSVESVSGIGSKKYKSCAVVGNSGILLRTEYGKLIDSHEIVIRLNNARIERYEQNVGAKTNISFINSNILHLCGRRDGCYCHPYGSNVPIIMYICQPVHFLDYTVCKLSHKAPILITDPRFDVLCGRIVKYYSIKRFLEERNTTIETWWPTHDGSMFHYSSGMQAVMLALGICDKVSIFGFGKSAAAKHHYHTNQKAELGLHDYEAEYDFYRDLVENPQAIPFVSDKFNFPPVSFSALVNLSFDSYQSSSIGVSVTTYKKASRHTGIQSIRKNIYSI